MENQSQLTNENILTVKSKNEKKETVATAKEFLRPVEASAYLGITNKRFYSLARSGSFPVKKFSDKITFVRKSDLDAWLEKALKSKKK